MYRKILLAYDGSLEGRTALYEGALLARQHHAEAYLLAITPLNTLVDAMGTPLFAYEAYDQIFHEGLAKARALGLEVTGAMVHGDAADEICTFAKKMGVDLVVVGHRRKSLLERWWSGPSQAALSDKLACSLLVARQVKVEASEHVHALDAFI